MRNLESVALACGLRLSAKRRIILRILDEACEPVSAREVHARALRLGQRVGLPSVYLTLHALTASGLLSAAPTADRTMRYRRTNIEHIERLVDVRSGRGRDFRSADMQLLLEETARALGYRLLGYRLELFGTANCAGSTDASGERTLRRARRERTAHRGGETPAHAPIRTPP